MRIIKKSAVVRLALLIRPACGGGNWLRCHALNGRALASDYVSPMHMTAESCPIPPSWQESLLGVTGTNYVLLNPSPILHPVVNLMTGAASDMVACCLSVHTEPWTVSPVRMDPFE